MLWCFASSKSGLGWGDYGIQVSALKSGGQHSACFDQWTMNRVAAGRCQKNMGTEMLMLGFTADSWLSQFWIRASCNQLYKCWLSRWRITGAERPGVYCLLSARERERERGTEVASEIPPPSIHFQIFSRNTLHSTNQEKWNLLLDVQVCTYLDLVPPPLCDKHTLLGMNEWMNKLKV